MEHAPREKAKGVPESKGYTDDEARLILSAALGPFPRLSLIRQAVRRWISWIAAYSGARLGEIAQLQKSSIDQHRGIWMMAFEDDFARRFVPVHPHLAEQGFLTFVAGAADGPLYYDREQVRRRGNPWDSVVADYSKWVRSLGLTDPDLLPAHAWRHRFAERARRVEIDGSLMRELMGRADPYAHKQFGLTSPATLVREIGKLSRYEVG